MNTIIMFLLVLCIFLMVSLGINYSKVVSTTITKMKEYTPSPISKTKYTTPVDYYSDTYASQGVFSKSVILETHILEPMTTKSPALPKNNVNKKGLQGSFIPKNNVETWGYKGTQGSKFTKNTNTESSKKYKGTNQIRITGCNSSQYGCCPDNITSKNSDGSNCPVGACSDSQYGCCPDNVTSKNADGSNCPVGCIDSQYGCCPDNVTSKNADGSNCSSVSGVVATGPVNTGYAVQGPQGNIYTGVFSNCSLSPYGCCPDNVTAKNAYGSNCPLIGGCSGTQYGCCPDNVTSKSADGSNCPIGGCSGTQYGCCPDNVTAKSADGSNCVNGSSVTVYSGTTTSAYPQQYPSGANCSTSQYGCCPDNFTTKNMDGSNCSPYPPPPVQPLTNTVFIPPPKKHYKSKKCSSDELSQSTSSSYDTTTPPPCPPCGRCPEPSFDCKKVPNYSSTNSEYLPMPVLNDFSQFGM